MRYYNSEEQNYYGQANNQQANSQQRYSQQANDSQQTVQQNYNQQANSQQAYNQNYNQQANSQQAYTQEYNQQANSQQAYNQNYNQQTNRNPYNSRFNYYGSSNTAPQNYGNAIYQQANIEPVTRKDFFRTFSSSKTNGWTITLAVICFVSSFFAVIQMIINYELLGILAIILSMIDLLFYTSMGIGLLATKRWGFSLAVLCYSTACGILTFILGAGFSGIFVIGVGLYTTMKLYYLNKAYKTYEKTGILPSDYI